MTVQTPADPELSVQQVNRKVAIGAAFMVLGRLAIRLISVVSTLILVRLLVPEDFGLIALAGAAIALADTLTATGYAVALVRRPRVDSSLYDTAWTMNLLRCLLLGGVVAVTSGWQSALLGDPRLTPVLQVIALTIALDGLMSVGLIRLQRELHFDLVFRHQIASRIVAFLVTILLAWATQSYWCLVLGNLFAKFVSIPYSYILAPYRPRWSLQHWRDLMSFSKWIFGQNLCTVADGQAANLLIGRFAGVHALGLYNVSYQIAATPVTEIAVPVRGPLYAGYAKLMHDMPQLRQEIAIGLGLLLIIIAPMSVGIALVAPEVKQLALGPGWAGAAPLIALCAIYALFDAAVNFTFNIFAVMDRMPRLVGTYTMAVAIRLPMVILGTLHAGAVGGAAALLATAVLSAALFYWQALRLLGMRAGQLLEQIARPIAAVLVMAAAVWSVRLAMSADDIETGDDVARLAQLVAVGAFSYILTVLILWRFAGRPNGAEQRLLTALRSLWRHLLSR